MDEDEHNGNNWIYIIELDLRKVLSSRANLPTVVKIGHSATKDPTTRIRNIARGLPWGVDVLAILPGTLEMEKNLHKKFNHCNTRIGAIPTDFQSGTEWYDKSRHDIMDLLSKLDELRDKDGKIRRSVSEIIKRLGLPVQTPPKAQPEKLDHGQTTTSTVKSITKIEQRKPVSADGSGEKEVNVYLNGAGKVNVHVAAMPA